jgi:hypothetical protein
MASTYTDRLGLEKQTDGENPNSWGAILNTNVIDLIDDAIAGYEIVSVSSTGITLTDNQGSTDQSRNAALEFAGTLTANVTITVPAEEKTYFVRENTTGSFAVQMKTVGGTALTLSQGVNTFVACNGTSIYRIDTPTSVASFTANTLTATSITTSVLDSTIINATSITTSVLDFTQLQGSGATFTGAVSVATLNTSGYVGIGNSAASYPLHVTGAIYATGDITAFSSALAKSNIKTIDNPLEKVKSLRGVSWIWKDNGESSQGLIYEEVNSVLPELTTNKGGYVGVKYQNIVGLLIESVKALKAEIDELRERH